MSQSEVSDLPVALTPPARVIIAKPGLDGHDRGAKVVLVTAYQVPLNLAAKVHAVLRKPTPPEPLIEALSALPRQA